MARLTIILPALGTAMQLEETLVSVLQNRPDDSDVLVAHRGNYDDPYDLAGEVEFLSLPEGTSLLATLNGAIQAASSDLLHILTPGAEVEEGWTDSALTHFHNQLVAAVVPATTIRGGSAGTTYQGITTGWAGSSRLCLPEEPASGPAWWSAFYRRQAVIDAGGFDEEIGASHADLDLAMTLQLLGYRTESEPSSRIVLSEIPATDASTPWETARSSERFRRRHDGEPNWLSAWCAYPLAIAGEFLAGLTNGRGFLSLSGRIAGWMEVDLAKRYEERAAKMPKAIAPESPRLLKFDAARSSRRAPATSSGGQRKAA